MFCQMMSVLTRGSCTHSRVLYSLEGLVLGADVEADGSSFDGERVHTVILHQHLCVLGGSQLDERLDAQTDQTDQNVHSD